MNYYENKSLIEELELEITSYYDYDDETWYDVYFEEELYN